jgi:ferredoxin-NADP reductase
MKTAEFTAKSRPFVRLKDWGLKPLVLDFYMQRIWPTFSIERVFARVVSKKSLSPHAVTLTLKPNFNFKHFKPGQHVLLTTTVDGQRYTRTYSPTLKSPRYLEITVKNIPDGKVSSQLCHFLKPGAIVEVSQPFGNMTWSELPPSSHYTFCAGGVGITPLRSLLHAWDKTPSLHQNKSIDLHYWARSEEELYFKEELLGFEKRNPRLKVHFYTTRSARADARIHEALFLKSETVFVACGPQSFVAKAEEIALDQKQRFYGEHAQVKRRFSILFMMIR